MAVYLITAREVGRVKIGCAYDPADRLRKMKVGSPCELVLEAMLPGSHKEERQIHGLFSDERVRGEWFTITEEIEKVIAANPAPRKVAEQDLVDLQPAKPPREPYEQSLWREEKRRIQKRLKAGDIHFPFRAAEAA